MSPWAVAPHPNFRSEATNAPGLLGLVSDYRPYDLPNHRETVFDDRTDTFEESLIKYAEISLKAESQEEASNELWKISTKSELDMGARTASAIYASVATVELDRASLAAVRLLDLAEKFLESHDISAEGLLCAQALLLHSTLRFWESGDDEEASRVLNLFSEFDPPAPTDFTDFETSQGISWSGRQVAMDLWHSIERNFARMKWQLEEFDGRSWIDVITGRPTLVETRLGWKNLERDRRLVREAAKRSLAPSSREWTVAEDRPILLKGLSALLTAELTADVSNMIRNRRAMAEVLFLTEREDKNAVTEALRLLRFSGEEKVLREALASVRSSGPTESLASAARVVLRRQTFPDASTLNDLLVLGGASDFLSSSELRESLQAAFGWLNAQRSRRRGYDAEKVWRAISRLVDGSQSDAVVADELLTFLETDESPDFSASACAQCVRRVEWDRVSPAVMERWETWAAGDKGFQLNQVRDAFWATAGVNAVPSIINLADGVEGAVQVLNGVVSSESLEIEASNTLSASLVESLRATRRDAAGGSIGFGAYDEFSIAVQFAAVVDSEQLWQEIAETVVDASLPINLKRAGLDSLADRAKRVPDIVRDALRDSASLLSAPQEHSSPFLGPPDELPLVPQYLRVAIAFDLKDLEDIQRDITLLAANETPGGRVEAARCLHLLARRGMAPDWAPTIALLLSHDREVVVRAEAGQALAAFLGSSSSIAGATVRRLLELLADDGVNAPLYVLHSLQTLNAQDLPPALMESVGEMAEAHPARVVRGAARIVIS